MTADSRQPSGNTDFSALFFQFLDLVMDFFIMMGHLIGMTKRQDTLFFQLMHLVHTDSDLFADFFSSARIHSGLVLQFFRHSFHSLAAAFFFFPALGLAMLTIL